MVAAVLGHSEPVPENAVSVEGPNFDNPHTLESFLQSYERIGFQANSLGKAINIVNRMVGTLYLLKYHGITENAAKMAFI